MGARLLSRSLLNADTEGFDEARYCEGLVLKGIDAETAAVIAAKKAAIKATQVAHVKSDRSTRSAKPARVPGRRPAADIALRGLSSLLPEPKTASIAKQTRIHSTKAAKASAAKAADLFDTALAIQNQEAAAAGQIGYMARAMIWASMPHKKIDGAFYKRDNGLASITMLVDPDIGLPYGKLPRLISAWLTREAKLTGSRELKLGRSFNEFVEKLGLSTSGGLRGDTSRLKMQATKLFSTTISLKAHQGQDFSYKNVALSDEGILRWGQKNPGGGSLWESTITLSEAFYRECMDYAVPFDLRVLHCLRSPLAIDLYLWLTWRMFILRRPALIPWDALRFQFGVGYATTPQGMAHFRAEFNRCLHDVHVLYPAARLSSERDGLRLLPSPPHVRALP
ncbi:replication protein RepA [Pseudomonas sp.]|uniref:replication protein RepA n=1 Tax=Pseudomonas sp. TaxID=306 RepID=UPI0028ACE234|nr:replication protein RepA [Pseudomonas sp.]